MGARPIRLSDMKDKGCVFFSPPVAQLSLHVVRERRCARESYGRTLCQLLSGSLHAHESPPLLPYYMRSPDVMASLDSLTPYLPLLHMSVSDALPHHLACTTKPACTTSRVRRRRRRSPARLRHLTCTTTSTRMHDPQRASRTTKMGRRRTSPTTSGLSSAPARVNL